MAIRASAAPAAPGDPDGVDVAALPVPATILQDPLGEELALHSAETTIRLSVVAGTLLTGPVRLTFHLEGRDGLPARILALRQLEALLRTGRVPKALWTPAGSPDRAMLVLQTLNALAAHQSTRAIASSLFGEDRASRDWNHESDYLRMKVRRLIARARQLAEGGYLDLLR